jgi:hypothetical protein
MYRFSQHLGFFRQMVLAAKIPAAIRHVKEALAAGNCVVIGLQSTGETRIKDSMGKKKSCSQLISPAKEYLLKLLENHFHTGDGFDAKEPAMQSLVDTKVELLKIAAALALPNNPIDTLVVRALNSLLLIHALFSSTLPLPRVCISLPIYFLG